MSNEPKKKSSIAEKWFVLGISLGVAFGIIFDNIGLWLPLGVCIGLVGPAWKKRMNKDDNHNEQGND